MTVVVRRKKLHRTTDPDTSRDAVPASDSRRAMSLRLLATFTDAEHTSEGAAHAAGVDPWQASKRVSELIQQRALEPTGEKRKGESGRAQRVLCITELGRWELKQQ